MRLVVLFAGIGLSLGASAYPIQTFHCTGRKDASLKATLELHNVGGPLSAVVGTTKVTGFFRKGSRLGKAKIWKLDEMTKTFWYQVENKPAVTAFSSDENDSSITYHFSFSRELLGKSFTKRKVNGWIDPDAPEGGGYPLDLHCSSK